MSEAQIAGVILGAVTAAVGLGLGIVSILNYGLESISVVIFFSVFILGALLVGIIWSH